MHEKIINCLRPGTVLAISMFLIIYGVGIDILIEQKTATPTSLNPFFDLIIPSIFLYKSVSSFFVSFSFALIIWVIVSQTVEVISKREQEEINKEFLSDIEGSFDDKIADISHEVFKGIFGVGFPPQYVDEVVRNVFTRMIYRYGFKSIYRLKETKDGSIGFRLNVYRKFTARNNGKAAEIIEPKLVLDAFKSSKFINNTSLISLKIDRKELIGDEEKSRFSKELNNTSKTEVIFCVSPLTLQPNEEVTVEINYEIFKEVSSNEIFQSTMPTSGFDIEMKNETDRDLDMGVNSIHRESFQPFDCGAGQKEKRWELSHPTLPHQGYILFWKPCRED